MKFSILIAHFNNFNYFRDCYDSLQKQTYQDFEVIIVDDGSSEENFEKLKAFVQHDPKFKIYQNQENKGVGYTKRRCVELASGEICGFLDPDDMLVPNALEISLKKYKNKEVVATYSKMQAFDNESNVFHEFIKIHRIKSGQSNHFNINFEINHFFTFRKSVYENTEGIDPELSSAVDQDLYLKIYEQGKISYIPKPLYLYRLHSGGVSQNKSKKEKLNENWHKVLKNTLKRRNIQNLYGKKVEEIESLPKFIFQKQNTLFSRLLKKLK